MVKDQIEVPLRFCGKLKLPHCPTVVCGRSSARSGYPFQRKKSSARTCGGQRVAATQPVPILPPHSSAEADHDPVEGRTSGCNIAQTPREPGQSGPVGPSKRLKILQSCQSSFEYNGSTW